MIELMHEAISNAMHARTPLGKLLEYPVPVHSGNELPSLKGRMKGGGLYDKDLQMYCEDPKSPDLEKMKFLRWMTEQGRLEHKAYASPEGQFARAAGLYAGPPTITEKEMGSGG